MCEVPTLDFSLCGTLREVELHEALSKALTEIGFAYFENHGMSDELISQSFQLNKDFFQLSQETKDMYSETSPMHYCGYKSCEILEEGAVPDAKEVFNVCPQCKNTKWPKELGKFDHIAGPILTQCSTFIEKMLIIFAKALKLDNERAFLDGFQKINCSEGNSSHMRFAYYPPIPSLQKNQLRCAAHTDYGMITLLFMNEVPGLQARNRSGDYIDVNPGKFKVLMNLGDLMQVWTGDYFLSAYHRVILPKDAVNKARYSMIYFSSPDDGYKIMPVVGDREKYRLFDGFEHIKKRLEKELSLH